MHVGRKAQKREKKAMSVSLYGNLFFVIVEIVMAIYTKIGRASCREKV